MKWENLLHNKCPKCNKSFPLSSYDRNTKMFTHVCGFKIHEIAFKRITSKQVMGRVGSDRPKDLK